MPIQVTYTAKWQLKDKPYYVWTNCNKLINIKTGKEIQKVIKGNKAVHYIDRTFTALDELKFKVELIKQKEHCPFHNETSTQNIYR